MNDGYCLHRGVFSTDKVLEDFQRGDLWGHTVERRGREGVIEKKLKKKKKKREGWQVLRAYGPLILERVYSKVSFYRPRMRPREGK